MIEYLWRIFSNSDERSVSTKRGEFLGSDSKCWFLGPCSMELVLYCSALLNVHTEGQWQAHCVCTHDSFVYALLLGRVKVGRGTELNRLCPGGSRRWL